MRLQERSENRNKNTLTTRRTLQKMEAKDTEPACDVSLSFTAMQASSAQGTLGPVSHA